MDVRLRRDGSGKTRPGAAGFKAHERKESRTGPSGEELFLINSEALEILLRKINPTSRRILVS